MTLSDINEQTRGSETDGRSHLASVAKRSGWNRRFDALHAMYRGWGMTLDAPLQCRAAHVERIKKHITRFPSKSICFPGDGE